MPTARLNPDLLQKLTQKTGKPRQRLREKISRKASKLGISSAAAQVVLAQEEGIGITRFLNKLPPEVRQDVRSVSEPASVAGRPRRLAQAGALYPKKAEAITAATIDSLLGDQALRGRCKDLLLARKHFDRVVREATTVLDDRLKSRSKIKNMNPVNLVGKVLNPDPQKAILVVSHEKHEQEGFHAICKGVMLAFRDRAHHALSDKFTRENALKFCGFIDSLLGAIEHAETHLERA
ncbi:MAG: TIGR02391 family protein [Candidatus Binatia bacterium]